MESKKLINTLIVEDDEIQLKLMEGLLQKNNFSFVSVKDGYSAIEKLNQEVFNLVISDINMPFGISGFNLVKTVRGIKELAEIPFIFVTGRSDKKDVERALEAGVDDYVVKPVDQDILLAKIEALISKKGDLFSFSERPTHSKGVLKMEFEICGISEQAIQFISPIPFPQNYKIKIESSIFNHIGISPPQLRVTLSEPIKEPKNFNRTRANFIGLTDRELGSIRRWTMLKEQKK